MAQIKVSVSLRSSRSMFKTAVNEAHWHPVTPGDSLYHELDKPASLTLLPTSLTAWPAWHVAVFRVRRKKSNYRWCKDPGNIANTQLDVSKPGKLKVLPSCAAELFAFFLISLISPFFSTAEFLRIFFCLSAPFNFTIAYLCKPMFNWGLLVFSYGVWV